MTFTSTSIANSVRRVNDLLKSDDLFTPGLSPYAVIGFLNGTLDDMAYAIADGNASMAIDARRKFETWFAAKVDVAKREDAQRRAAIGGDE